MLLFNAVLVAILLRQSVVGEALVKDFSGVLLEDANAVDDADAVDGNDVVKDDEIFFNGNFRRPKPFKFTKLGLISRSISSKMDQLGMINA